MITNTQAAVDVAVAVAGGDNSSWHGNLIIGDAASSDTDDAGVKDESTSLTPSSLQRHSSANENTAAASVASASAYPVVSQSLLPTTALPGTSITTTTSCCSTPMTTNRNSTKSDIPIHDNSNNNNKKKNKNKNNNNNNNNNNNCHSRQITTTEKSKTTSTFVLHHEPILVIAPPNTPLGIDIHMTTPTIAYIQPTSPLLHKLHIGDVLVYVDGRSTAELSHGAVTKLLNGARESTNGSSSSSRRRGARGGDDISREKKDTSSDARGNENDGENGHRQHHLVVPQHPHPQRKFVFLSRVGSSTPEKQRQQQQHRHHHHHHHQQQQQQQQQQHHHGDTTTTTSLPQQHRDGESIEPTTSAIPESFSSLVPNEEGCSCCSNMSSRGTTSRNENVQLDDKNVITKLHKGGGGRECSPCSVIIKSLLEVDDDDDDDANITTRCSPAATPALAGKKLCFDDDGELADRPPPPLSFPLSEDLPTIHTPPPPPPPPDCSNHLNNVDYPSHDNIMSAPATPLPMLLTPLTPLQRGSGASGSSYESNHTQGIDDQSTYFSGTGSLMESQTYRTCRSNIAQDQNDASRVGSDNTYDGSAAENPVADHGNEQERTNPEWQEWIQHNERIDSSQKVEEFEDEDQSSSCSAYSSHRQCVSCPGAIGGGGGCDISGNRWVIRVKDLSSNSSHEQVQDFNTNNDIELLRTQRRVHEDLTSEGVLGKVQSGDEGGDATSLPLTPMEADRGVEDEDVKDGKTSDKKRTTSRLERRKYPAPLGIDYITVPNVDEHDNHHSIVDEVSTIYGGVWNAALAGGHRLEDTLGCLEDGYAIGMKYDPNTYSQLRSLGVKRAYRHRCQERNSVIITAPKQKEPSCVEEDIVERKMNDVVVRHAWKQNQLCVDGSLVLLLVLVILSFVAIVVLVIYRKS